MATETDAASYFLTKGLLSVVESISKIAASAAGLNEKERNKALLDCSIPYLKYQSEDGQARRPIRLLNKYLDGSGEDEPVDLFELLAEDKGVRGSVHRQIATILFQQDFFNSTGIDISKSGRLAAARSLGVQSDPLAYKRRLTGFQTRELQLDIAQSDFRLQDWANAIGAFKLSWSLVGVRDDRQAVFAKLWGTNVYRWHPEAPRKSQVIHRAAERMKEFGAKEFKIVFKPCLMSIGTGDLARL